MTNPVLILGAGVNGAALARDLLLNGVPVVLVDRFDLAYGATSKSSRLIHGGVRYLEYGDLRLVRESLAERSRLLSLAPHRVRPLKLAIPVKRRFGGFITAAARFIGCGKRFGLRWLRFLANRNTARGLWVVRMGLWLYDRFSNDKRFANHTVQRVDDDAAADVDPQRYRWLCTYADGQMAFPERFVVDLLTDARQIAVELGLEFRLHTYADVRLAEGEAMVTSTDTDEALASYQPSAIVNATGAWGDATLEQLGVPSRRLFGGTKGSHIITRQPRLISAIKNSGVYAEADDGRMVFVLPYRDAVLVGTTDIRFEQPPHQAVTRKEEIAYLLELANDLFPRAKLTPEDVVSHYSGVRPLPYAPAGKTSAISRDHHVEFHADAPLPVFTLIGGKLTTARAFGELAAKEVLSKLGITQNENTRNRPLPGGEGFPDSPDAEQERITTFANDFGVSPETAAAMWELFGTQAATVLTECGNLSAMIDGTPIPNAVVRWVIEHEWVERLDDLVERRLLLVDRPGLSRATLESLAAVLRDAEKSPGEDAVETCIDRLRTMYGLDVER